MYIRVSYILLFFVVFLPTEFAFSQAKRYKIYNDYIDNYKGIAIDHMGRYKIPASITLAQGLLESGGGNSSLTLKSNNHFGIKCHNDWRGDKVYHSDDNPNDCFRKYKKAEESFEDHSRFLADKQRYQGLFALNETDYRGWARGLQKAGYATDKAYANKLIKFIEDYELYLYDINEGAGVSSHNKNANSKATTNKTTAGSKSSAKNNNKTNTPKVLASKHTPYRTHNLVYVIANNSDSYEAIAEEFNFNARDLYSYNEVPKGFPIKAGDLIYFQKKKPKADRPYFDHVVQIGESMHSISQKYGVNVKSLYSMNKKDYEYVPEEGDVLKLR